MACYEDLPAPSTWVNWEAGKDVVEFTNSITVGSSRDGTFFMTNGFSAGYMGLQDRTPKWVIFSVWDEPDDPAELLELGPRAKTEAFGGEGTGGKSWLEYDWQLGTTYTLRVTARPGGEGTVFSGHFLDPEEGWVLLASFRTKPRGGHFLRDLGSFVEDWICEGNGCERMFGGVRRECVLGPPLVRLAGAEESVLCSACRGESCDDRLPRGYLHRHVYLAGAGRVGVATGGDGSHPRGTSLYCGPLRPRGRAANQDPVRVRLAGPGPHAGEYCSAAETLNGRPVFRCAARGAFVGFDGSEWHLAEEEYLAEVLGRQGEFGSLDHSTNGAVSLADSVWEQYSVIALA